MRIGAMLSFMLVAAGGLLGAAAVTEQAWPLFAIWPALALAIPLAKRERKPSDPA